MAVKIKKTRKHSFLDKHTAVGAVLLMIWGLIGAQGIFGPIVGRIFSFIHMPDELSIAIGALIVLFIHYLWFKPEYEGSLIGGNISLGFKLACFMCIYYIYIVLQTFVWGQFHLPSFTGICTAVMAGVVEEITFRALPISLMMRNWKERKKLPVVIAIASICFALTHGLNALAGAPLPITVIQVLATCFMGVLFSAVYIRCGNILPVMIMHGLTDYLCFMDITQMTESGLMIAELGMINYLDVAVCMILAAAGIYLIRPKKYEEISDLWNRKWNRAEN